MFHFLNFLEKKYLLIAFLLYSFILWIVKFFFVNEIFIIQKLPGGMLFIRSCNQIFMTCSRFYNLLLTSENKNIWHILYKQWLYKCFKILRRLHRMRHRRSKHKKCRKTKQLVFQINRWKMQNCINSYWTT